MAGEPIGEVFDPKAPLAIHEHFRPHWPQAGAIVFLTFRTADSIPRQVINRWEHEKNEWIHRDTSVTDCWKKVLPTLPDAQQRNFRKEFSRRREVYLDSCHGECVLRTQSLAQIVADSLLRFDGDHYRLGDFVIMPNHVHLLASFENQETLVKQSDSWLHYTARQINLQLERNGKLWQQEPFDHLVRSSEQYEYLQQYIRDNGRKARPHLQNTCTAEPRQ